MLARARPLAAALCGLVALVAPLPDVAPPHSHRIDHLLVVDDVADFRAWKFFLGPRDAAHSGQKTPFIPLEPAEPAGRSASQRLDGLDPLDFGFAEVQLYVAKRELLVDGMPRRESRLVSVPLVAAERDVDARDPTQRRVTTYHVKSIAPLEVELVSDERFDAAGGRAWSLASLLPGRLLLTIAVELVVAALLLRRFDRRLVLTMVLVNSVTHPPLSLVVLNGWLAAPVAEGLVILLEWPLDAAFLRVPWRRALGVAVVTNLASWGVGALV